MSLERRLEDWVSIVNSYPLSRCVAWVPALLIALSGCQASPHASSQPFSPGTHKVVIAQRVLGIRRSYYVHIPVGDTGTMALPIVVALHGAFSTARQFERETGLSPLADIDRFIVIYPQGFGLGNFFRHWNSGHCCGRARKMNLDDVSFALATVDDLARHNPIDRHQLYVAGFSNGGMLAYRIAAEHPDIIAAVAAVSATIGGIPSANEPEWTVTRPKLPISVLAIHGFADESVPYEGGRGAQTRGMTSAISVTRSIGFWVQADGCGAKPQSQRIAQGHIEQSVWSHCASDTEVALYSVNGWGHQWPRKDQLGGFDAAQTIWRFFERHPLALH